MTDQDIHTPFLCQISHKETSEIPGRYKGHAKPSFQEADRR